MPMDEELAAGQLAGCDAFVGLVGDLADDLLDDVFDRHDAGGATVLFGDDSEGHVAAPEIGEDVVECARLGDGG